MVPFTKSLRIITDETLSWENHIEYISNKIKHGIGVLGRSKNVLSKELLNMLYKTLIEPYFRYGKYCMGSMPSNLAGQAAVYAK